MLEISWITAILQLYSQVTDLFGNVIVKRINIRLFLFIGTISLHIEFPSYAVLNSRRLVATNCGSTLALVLKQGTSQ